MFIIRKKEKGKEGSKEKTNTYNETRRRKNKEQEKLDWLNDLPTIHRLSYHITLFFSFLLTFMETLENDLLPQLLEYY
jgi:hypothetical protein